MIDTLVETLRKLKKYCSSEEFNVDEFTLMLKEYGKEYGITPNELLELLYNKDLLVRKISYKTKVFDDQIKQLKKQISTLEDQKYQYGSLICELHGHSWERTDEYDSEIGHVWFCTYCGKTKYLAGHEINNFLSKEEQSKRKIYKYEKTE